MGSSSRPGGTDSTPSPASSSPRSSGGRAGDCSATRPGSSSRARRRTSIPTRSGARWSHPRTSSRYTTCTSGRSRAGFPALSAHVLVAPGADCHAVRRRLERMLDRALRPRPHDASGRPRAGTGAPASEIRSPQLGSTAVRVARRGGSRRQDGDRHRRFERYRRGDGAGSLAAGATVAAGARRTDLIPEGAFALELDVTDPASCEAVRRGERSRSSAGSTSSSTAPGSRSGATRSGTSTEDDERVVLETNVNGLIRMTRLCVPHIRDGGHIVNIGSVAGRPGVRERRALRHVQVRGPRLHVCAARGPARPADPPHHRRSGARRDRVLARPLPRRRGDRGAVYAGVEPLTPDDIAECVLFALTRPAARQRRRARGQGARAVVRRRGSSRSAWTAWR